MVLFIQTSDTLFLKLLIQDFFSIPLDALQKVLVINAKTWIQGFQNMDYLCCFNIFPSRSMAAN